MSVRRIVSLTCSNTEIVAALGCCDRLVGVDDYSDFPPEVTALRRVGPDLGIDVDAVAALAPDLVLASLTVPGHEKVVERIAAAGLPYIAPSPTSIAEIYENVAEIAELLGVAAAGRRVIAEMRAGLVERPPRDREERPVIAIQWWPKPPILPGGRSWADDLIRRAGGVNPLGDEPVESRAVPLEELAALDPDAIVLSWCGVESPKIDVRTVAENPALAGVRAVLAGRVLVIPEAWLGRPSPRLVEGYAALCRLIDTIDGDLQCVAPAAETRR